MHYINVFIRNGRHWQFKWDANQNAFLYSTKKNLYRLFFDLNHADGLWVGRRFWTDISHAGWYTVEKELQATHAVFMKGKFFWRQSRWHEPRLSVRKKR